MTSRRSLPRLAAVLAATAALALSACSGGDDGKYFKYTSATATGKLVAAGSRKPAADFDGTLLSGGKTSLAATRGKVTVVNFWASWCGPCQTETPQLDLFYRRMKSQNVTVLGVDSKDAKANATYFVSRHKISYPIVYDQQGETAIKLGNPPGLPVTYLIDKQGRVAAVYIGGLTGKDLEGPVDKLRAEK